MEGKIIIGFLTAIILGITATFLNSEKLSKTQKIILFILILFPPAQWILGIILLNNHKINLKRKTRTIISKNNEDIIALDKKNYEILIKKKRINRDKGVKNLEEKNAITQNMYDKKVALLKKSFDMNLISKTEFDTKLKNIEHENNEAEKEIQNSEKFEISKNTLKKMYDNEILSKEEYDLKVQEQKEIIYKIKSDNTIDTAEPINETKKNTANEYTMFFFWFAIIIISTSIVFYKCTSNNTTKQTEIKSDMYFENQIQFLLLAESKEDFSEVSEYFDLYNIKRYWNMSNPSYNELNRRYKDFWKKTSHSTHNINLITKKENKVFDVNIDYEFLNEENNEWKEINYNIRFVFGQNNKIIEVYGLK